MASKTSNLKLNINYDDNETFNDVTLGSDENYQIIDTKFMQMIDVINVVNQEFAESIDLEESGE